METLESKQSIHKVPYRIKWKKNAGPLIASTSSRLLSLCGGNARPWWSDLKADGDRGAAQVKADEVKGVVWGGRGEGEGKGDGGREGRGGGGGDRSGEGGGGLGGGRGGGGGSKGR